MFSSSRKDLIAHAYRYTFTSIKTKLVRIECEDYNVNWAGFEGYNLLLKKDWKLYKRNVTMENALKNKFNLKKIFKEIVIR